MGNFLARSRVWVGDKGRDSKRVKGEYDKNIHDIFEVAKDFQC